MDDSLLMEAKPNSFIDKTGLVQVVGLPYSGKTIFSNFLSTIYPEDESVWITNDTAYSFTMKRKIATSNDYNFLINTLDELEDCGDFVVIIDPLFVYEAGDDRSFFYNRLKGFSGGMLIIFVNKIMYDVKKRIGGSGEKMWGGNVLSSLCDYIFRVKSDEDENSNEFVLDIMKSLKTPPTFGINLLYENAVLKKHTKIEKEI